jgi:hypothetical protein
MLTSTSPPSLAKDLNTMKKNKIGSSFDDFLKEEGIREDVTVLAVERVRAWQTSLPFLDAHVVAPAEYKDAPELTDAQLAAANVHEGGKLVRHGHGPQKRRDRC